MKKLQDPPDFAAVCMLMFTINIGEEVFPVDIEALDAWAKNIDSPATMQAYARKRKAVVAAFVAGNDDEVGEMLAELHQLVHLVRALPLAHGFVKQKANRRITNQKSAEAPRPSGRIVDHEDIAAQFGRLVREGHTRREANGMLFLRGLASRSTIWRITKKFVTSAG
jgi:hypothetical protein